MKMRNFRYWYWDRIIYSGTVLGILVYLAVTPN